MNALHVQGKNTHTPNQCKKSVFGNVEKRNYILCHKDERFRMEIATATALAWEKNA